MISVDTAKNRFVPVITLVLASALSGCATFGGAVGKCQAESCSADAKITSDVQANLKQHPQFAANQLQVQTVDGVVYLNGIVSAGLARTDAEMVARQTPAVTQVVDNVAISK
jgi:osmotically-inducible protein OsmY